MKIHDISLTTRVGMATYPSVPQPSFTPVGEDEPDNSFRSSMITLHSHTGTHVDSPAHLLKNGTTIDNIDLSQLCGEAVVLEIDSSEGLTKENFQERHNKYNLTNKIVLLKTGEGKFLSQGIFREDYLAPPKEVVELLVTLGMTALGVDTLSVDAFSSEEVQVHPLLFEAGIPAIEGLYLEEVSEGPYFCCCLPLKMESLDGSPARAVLIEKSD